MSLTRANVEAILIQRCGPLLTQAGMDGTTINGTNASLNDPLGRALRTVGAAVANPVSVADGDVAAVTSDQYDMLFDLAQYQTLRNVRGNLTKVDTKVGPIDQSFSQLARQVEKDIEQLRIQIQEDYGLGVGSLQAGVLGLDFAQKDSNPGIIL